MLELEFDDESGFRFLLLKFKIGDKEVPMIFEENLNEDTNLISLLLRSAYQESVRYKIKLEGLGSSLEYEGNVLKFDGKNIEESQQCLKVHSAQLRHFAYISDDRERRYKIVVSII